MNCSSLEPKQLDFWRCDMCVIAERVARRRRREASDMAVINSYRPRKVDARDVGTARKRFGPVGRLLETEENSRSKTMWV